MINTAGFSPRTNAVFGIKNCRFNTSHFRPTIFNKGFIFTLDITLAILFVIIIVTTANYYTRVDKGSIEEIQMTRIGADIAALLDNTNLLDTLSESAIESKLEVITPPNYGMRINVKTVLSGNYAMGDEIPEDTPISTGKRVFVLTQGDIISDYGIVQYYIWLR